MKCLPRIFSMVLMTVMAGAYAGQSTAAGADGGPPPHRMGHGMHGDADMLSVLARTHAELKLSPDQEAKWQDAESASKALRATMRAQHDKLRATVDAERQKEVMDLAALDQAMRSQHEALKAEHDAVRGKWLALYQSLDANQKRLVSQHVKDRLARMDEMRERWQAHRKQPPQAAPKG